MAESVDMGKVISVLLAGEWVTVRRGTFKIQDDLHYAGQDGRPWPVSSPGPDMTAATATWETDKKDMITCPLSSIQAVKWS